MMHSESTTRSPSSLSFTRSTPWVEGCCGPMFKIISSAPRTVVLTLESSVVRGSLIYIGRPSLTVHSLTTLDAQVLANPIGILFQNVVILAQRVALPFVGHQNARQVRMAFEDDSKHVVAFAFQPICSGPDFADAWDRLIFASMCFQAETLVLGERIQNQNYVESFFAFGPVDGG